jgi:hypothetical protein
MAALTAGASSARTVFDAVTTNATERQAAMRNMADFSLAKQGERDKCTVDLFGR